MAREYLKVMKELDVEINLSKSLVSRNGYCEFAKRFISKEEILSGASLLEFTSLTEGFSNIIALARRYKLPQSKFNRLLGRGSRSQGHNPNIVTSSKVTSNFIDSVLYSICLYKPYSLFKVLESYLNY